MPLRIPPGRAGRTWLLRRLDVAHRGAELLDRKRQVLLAEQSRVRAQADQARGDWLRAASQLEIWTERAGLVDGELRLELLARHAQARASLELSWTNLMGAQLPRAEAIEIPQPPPLSALGASSAAVLLARAGAEAARAAARYAIAQRADAELSAELGRAARRLRALRDRWIPQHEQALAALDLTLDEAQREQAIRIRWLTERNGSGIGRSG
ncbi:MAG TPA: V-type ATP synthase subunit D [Solirubrobacteraceae bacterium]|nr:V-type ATP synthase subunit D [Solirubrobacteraceae bacterium]